MTTARTITYSLSIDPNTRDYVFNPSTRDLEKTPIEFVEAYFRLVINKGQWMYASNDPNGSIGSDLWRFKNKKETANPVSLQSAIYASLAPMLQLQELSQLSVEYTGIDDNGEYIFRVDMVTTKGQPLSFSYPNFEIING